MEEQDKRNEASEGRQPLYRVWLCGPFHLEQRIGTTYQPVDPKEWGGRRSPFKVLKALLCAPGRQMRRAALIATLWPEMAEEQGLQKMNVALTLLRKVFRGVAPEVPLLDEQTKVIRLADQSYLWVDVDAAAAFLEQAEREGGQAPMGTFFLEEALRYLARGSFLEEEEGEWVVARRALLERQYYRCRVRLADLYGQQGRLERAETLLSTLLQEDPTDEEILCRLLSLLHKQGMTHQALRLYECFCNVCTTEGIEPTEGTKALAAQLQVERLHARRTVDPSFSLAQHTFLSKATANNLQADKTISQRFPMSGNLLGTAYDPHLLTESFSEGVNDTMNRREASKKIALTTLGVSLLTNPIGLMQTGAMFHDEDILAICTTFIPILWRLYFDGHLSEVQQILPAYLSQLALLTRQSRYQQQAAHVASKAHQLACMLALQEQDYGFAFIYADQALFAANVAEDSHLQVASLIRRALVYRYLQRYQPMLEAYQEAEHTSKNISPLLQGRLYTGLAESHSHFAQEYEAKQFLERAYATFPENPYDDPHYSYTHFKLPQGFEAIMHLNLKQPLKAWAALAHVDQSLPETIVPDRVELSIDQAKASLLLREIAQCCHYLKFAANAASALGSALRYNEAFSLYQHVQRQWPYERHVRDLANYFQ